MSLSFDDECFEVFKDPADLSVLREKVESNNEYAKISEECEHAKFLEEDGVRVCRMCGKQLKKLDFDQEWKWHGDGGVDASRCHKPKTQNKGNLDKLYQDYKISISDAYKKKIDQFYQQIVGESTVRGKGRRAIVAASLFYTYADDQDFRDSSEIRELFDLDKSKMSDGINRFLTTFAKYRTLIITPKDLINRAMIRAGIPMCHYQDVLKLEAALKGKFPNSSPLSVASAIVYLFLCSKPELKKQLGLTKSKFAEKVSRSDITVTKLVKETANLVGIVVSN